MCGIAGYTGDGDPATLDAMLARLVHRGPDDAGHHLEPGVALGARRLRVIDPAGGHQPVANETGTVWVVLNGEIYNYRELRDELIGKGHRFASRCDTEVLVHLYEQEGEEGVRRLRGMYAFALWDRDRRTLFLARDRLGIKPLYYTTRHGSAGGARGVAFASELPALLAAVGTPAVSPDAVHEYLTRLYVPGPGTIFEGVRQVAPGELLRVRGTEIDAWRYDRPRTAADGAPLGDREAAAERFRALLRETVKAHLISDVPLGLFLSGGLDSGAILAMMRQVVGGPIKTFSIGYADRADGTYDERPAARALARHFETDHCETRLEPDAVQLLPRIVAAMAEPFADASAIPTYVVAGLARRSVTVALSGIGGDELFGGYPRYLGLRLAARYARAPAALRAWLAGRVAPHLPDGATSTNRWGRARRFLRNGHLPLARQYLAWTTFLPVEWEDSVFTPAFLDRLEPAGAPDYAGLFEAWPGRDPADQAMGLDVQTYLPDDLLRMGDRLSMAHSLELRVPFCDHELLRFACRLPASLRFSRGRLKGFMREALATVLPPALMTRAKHGFQVPLARWLREDWREMAHDLLADDRIRRRGYVTPEYVRWLLAQHQSGSRDFADQLYALLVLELWHEQQGAGTRSCSTRPEAAPA